MLSAENRKNNETALGVFTLSTTMKLKEHIHASYLSDAHAEGEANH